MSIIKAKGAEDGSSTRLIKDEKATSQESQDKDKSLSDIQTKHFGRYQILEELGRGGMSRVFKVYHSTLDQVFALKVMESAAKDEIARFRREAQLVIKLNHPNIVTVHDAGVINEKHYLLMDFLEGQTLDSILSKNKSLPYEDALLIAEQIANALDYAHSQGVIHRDIKPGNIMIDSNKKALLTDFGLAKRIDIDSKLTAMGTVIGTPNYMSPEQALGKINNLDARTDIYGLGGVLYHMLTGRVPIAERNLMATLYAVARKEPTRPREINPDIPEEVEILCLKALKKKPEHRFQSAGEFIEAIHNIREGKKIETPSIDNAPTRLEQIFPEIQKKKEGEYRKIGRYHIVSEIGRGGMGIVYLAEDEALKRTVALKILLAGKNATDEENRRFLREAQMAARLDHPNLVSIYEVGVCEEGVYFTMEYFPGQNLGHIIKGEQGEEIRSDYRRAASLIEQILGGVAYAHEHGIIHRDLKPGNILIKGQEIKITDFGLAREIRPEEHITQSGTFVGTPLYAPPEQLLGRISNVDPTMDVYSIGVILYELITGKPPFSAPSSHLLVRKILTEDPIPPRKIRSQIPKDLDTICLKAIEKHQHLRYKSALAFAEDIKRLRMGQPILAVPPTLITRVSKAVRRHRNLVFGASIVLILCLSFLGFMVYKQEMEARDKNSIFINKFEEYLQNGRFNEAITRAQEFEKENPILAKSSLEKADTLRQKKIDEIIQEIKISLSKGEKEKAERFLRDLVFIDSNNVKIREFEANLKILSAPKRKINFSPDLPLQAEVKVYPISSKNKTIQEEPVKFGEVLELPISLWYIFDISVKDYAPLSIMVYVSPDIEELNLPIKLVNESQIRGMVYIPHIEEEVTLGFFGNSIRKVRVPGFAIDKFEVTNGQYDKFIIGGGYNTRKIWDDEGWNWKEENHITKPDNWDAIKDESDLPVTGISWYEANAFANWSGKSLPTEDEWEKSARGLDQRIYPWGNNTIDDAKKEEANIARGRGKPIPVTKIKGDTSPYGVIGMAGNVAEWVYQGKNDPRSIIKGGAFGLNQKYAACPGSKSEWKKERSEYIGFRCVKKLDKK